MSPASFARGWLALTIALALHVCDEALTGFLDVYNPTVRAIRAELPWFPMPTFTFQSWLAGLVALCAVLFALTPFARRGAAWLRPVAYVLSVVMILNAVGHTLGTMFGQTVASVRFVRPMPGFYSAPLLLAAASYLIWELRRTRSEV